VTEAKNSGAIHFSTLVGKMKFDTQNEELLIVHIIACIILPEYFSIRLVQWKCTDDNTRGKKMYFKKCSSKPRLRCSYFQHIFTKRSV